MPRIYHKPPHRATSGMIPNAGSTSASTFAKRRENRYLSTVNAWKRVAKAKTPKAVIASIPESRYRFIPPHELRQSGGETIDLGNGKTRPEFITFRGRSGKLSSNAPTMPVGEGWQEVGGYQAFPTFGLLPSITAGAQMALGQREDRFGKKRQLVDIKGIKSTLNRLLAIAGLPHVGARFVVWHVGRWCLMEIISKTPLDTGTAAAGWTISPQLRGKGKGYGNVGFRIGTDVEYVKYLEYGHHDYPPQFMMRGTFQQARGELRHVMDILIDWWKQQQITLRNMRFDVNLSAGVLYNEEDVEQAIPRLSWQRLHSMIEERLPMKDVSELNTSAALAYRIRDPKDWHTAEGFKDPGHVFEAHIVKERQYTLHDDEFNLGRDFEVPGKVVSRSPLGTRDTPVHAVKIAKEEVEVLRHVRTEMPQDELQRQVEDLRKAWGAK